MITYKYKTDFLKAALAMALGCMTALACTDGNGMDVEEANNSPCIELTISADELVSRTVSNGATSPFTPPEKEKLNSVDLFFYTWDATDDTVPVKVDHIDKPAIGMHTIKLSNDEINKLFVSSKPCKVYAVVNVSEEDYSASGVTTKGSATISQLREIRANTRSFATTFDGFVMFTDEDAGDSYNVVTYNESERKASGTLKLKNLAAKIDLFVNFPDPDKGEWVSGIDPSDPSEIKNWYVYKPTGTDENPSNVEVYIVNGTTAVPLYGWTDVDYKVNDQNTSKVASYLTTADYYDLRDNNGKNARHLKNLDEETQEKEKFRYKIDHSIYSYPNQWTSDMMEQHQTYLIMRVNWMPDANRDNEDDDNVLNDLIYTYYKIPINLAGDSENKLRSNRYYRVKVNINTLGGANFGEPMEVEASCEVLPWGETTINTDIYEFRSISIPQKQVDPNDPNPDTNVHTAVMNNTVMTTIPYISTHKIKLSEVSIQYYNFNVSGYTPQLVNILSRREGEKGETFIRNDEPLSTVSFMLNDEKFAWYEKHNEEPNGVVIDEENSKIIFYKSVYTLAGFTPGKEPHPDAPNGGLYGKYGNKPYSPFFIKLKFEHVDDPTVSAWVDIIQYPGVYVTFEENSGKTFNNEGKWVSIGRKVSDGESPRGGTSRYGVYVNGGATDTWAAGRRVGQDGFREEDPSNSLQLGGIGGRERGPNPNMYVIHVTQLTDDEKETFTFGPNNVGSKVVTFHVGDPRMKNYNNNLASNNGEDLQDVYHDMNERWTATNYDDSNAENFRRAPATIVNFEGKTGNSQRLYPPYDGDQTLCYYYPTNEGQTDEQAFMIAPAFRLASGNTDVFVGGVTSLGDGKSADNLSRENARRRCAALQESGLPAGRWRLPTVGEYLFYKMLQKRNVIPAVFSDSRAHWTAQYLMKFNQDGYDVRIYPASELPKNHKWVRCVYDDWYWVKRDKDDNVVPDDIVNNEERKGKGRIIFYKDFSTDGDIREMFVWGDKLKNNPQEQ